MSTGFIEVKEVSKTFTGHLAPVEALERVSFSVAEGQFVSLVGPSGCGKSTLLQILAGLMPSSRGEVHIAGECVRGPMPEKIGMVFQEALLLPWKTAAVNIGFPLELRGVPKGARRERAHTLLSLVGMCEVADRYPHELSMGMRQRIAIARGLVHDPSVVLMDEPFAALDEQTRVRMGQELLAIWQETRKTVLFITHSLAEAIYLSDTVLVMGPRPGRILEVLDIELPRPRTPEMIGSEVFGRLRNHIWHLIGEAQP